ncbi:efflux RND transporter periplasmic adaptor subunit [Hyphomicrobium sp. NDB2Meth4]|uniref:efflux RND transporter periplasmic adaptor subunit n=1 Tax=Hyphomicrobium sp. NDB2Meth4 TaxID=1892846 RepID=UPI00092FF683|nr:efflux RND transporter periplasmic adaptor subunit [Hyphomicrobium sp. NDB2Meth4]
MLKLFKSLFAILVIGGLTAAAVHFSSGTVQNQRQGRFGRMDGPVPVVTTNSRLENVPVWLEGVGTAKARNTVTVRPQVDGKILSINFKEGQDVKAGDLLAQIDPVTFQAQLDQAVAKKALDESQLANAKRDLERYDQLSSNVIAAKTVDTQRALVAQLEAQIKSDDAAIENARAVLGYATVVAPISGRTGMRLIDVGNLVRASDAGIVVITEVQPISVLFTLPQQDLPEINKAVAQRALRVEALETDSKNVLDTGELEVIDNQVDQTTGTIRLKADFPNKDLQLWPGQFVNVRLLLDTLQQVVVVPTSAVQRGPDGAFVYVIKDGKAAVRSVALGQQDEKIAVITKGLAAAEPVVTTGFARLKDGADVTIAPPAGTAPSANGDKPQAINANGGETSSIMTATPAMQGDLRGEFRQGKKRGEGRHKDGKRGAGKRGPRREAGNPSGTTP